MIADAAQQRVELSRAPHVSHGAGVASQLRASVQLDRPGAQRPLAQGGLCGASCTVESARGEKERQSGALVALGGAEALGLADSIGSLEAGKLADVCAVDLAAPHFQPVVDVEAAVLYSASARDVILTVVEGEVLYDGKTLARMDPDCLKEPLAAIREKLNSAG